MEILIMLIVIIVLAVMIGVEPSTVLLGVMLLMALMLILMTGFFIICSLWLIGSKKCSGKLSKVDDHPRFKFPAAYYEIDGEVYPNIFPCEMILKNWLYAPDRQCRVRLNKKKSIVFDGNAYFCVILGIILGAASLVFLAAEIGYIWHF